MSNIDGAQIAQDIKEINNNSLTSSIEKNSIFTTSVILGQMIIIFLIFLINKKVKKIEQGNLILFIIAFLIILILLILTIIIKCWRAKNLIKTDKKCKGICICVICLTLNGILLIYSILADIGNEVVGFGEDAIIIIGERTFSCLETYSLFHMGIWLILVNRIQKKLDIPEEKVFVIQKIETINYQGQGDDSNIFSATNIGLLNKSN